MAVVIMCPECDKEIRVSPQLQGKKIKCKDCSHIFVVKIPKSAQAEQPKPTKSDPGKKPVPEPLALAKDEDDEDDGKAYGVETVDLAPRCPHCTELMDPPEAVVCLNCGYNVRSRTRAEIKAYHGATGEQTFYWLLPGILCLIGSIMLLVLDGIAYANMASWLEGSFLQNEDKTWLVKPNAFTFYIVAISLAFVIPMCRFAYKRLFINNKPPEEEIKL